MSFERKGSASAIVLADSMVNALMSEKATFARMFETPQGSGGGIRATVTAALR